MTQVNPVSGTNTNNTAIDQSQLSSMNNDQITAMLVGGNLDPKFATMLLNQMSTNNVNSILFGNNESEPSSSIDFGDSGLMPNNVPGTTSINNSFGSSAFSNVSPQFELSVYSSLIGKTVSATNPLTSKVVTDKVSNVLLQNGKVMLNVNGVMVPPENLLSISK